MAYGQFNSETGLEKVLYALKLAQEHLDSKSNATKKERWISGELYSAIEVADRLVNPDRYEGVNKVDD